MIAIERQWAEAVLSGFTAGSVSSGQAPPLEGVDYVHAIESLVEHGNPITAVGVRFALLAIATSPAWHWGERRTMVALSPAERAALLAELVDHPSFAVRELAILMKIQAAMALFGNPAMRAWSAYGRDAGRPRLTQLRAVRAVGGV
jgi:hypothetical protein